MGQIKNIKLHIVTDIKRIVSHDNSIEPIHPRTWKDNSIPLHLPATKCLLLLLLLFLLLLQVCCCRWRIRWTFHRLLPRTEVPQPGGRRGPLIQPLLPTHVDTCWSWLERQGTIRATNG